MTATPDATPKVIKPRRPGKANATTDQVVSTLYAPATRHDRSDRVDNDHGAFRDPEDRAKGPGGPGHTKLV
ncbi:hypothetical protein Taro_003317 [Colocasia esculenta]|uniref:Uncharacterized protein n=1 Tax=Colocasia esculenta TaxID=4460 RepID=A0A843TNP5_COLES|nr:hypothetical protein [Colocasia esculenta]